MDEPTMLTFLKMQSLDDLRPAIDRWGTSLSLRALPITSPLIRDITLGIGRPYDWPSQRWSDNDWAEYLRRPFLSHWMLDCDGSSAGLVSIDFLPDGKTEIDTFGLLPAYVGRGMGGSFLTMVVRHVFMTAPNTRCLWLHTASTDHPHALHNYLARGFQIFPHEQS